MLSKLKSGTWVIGTLTLIFTLFVLWREEPRESTCFPAFAPACTPACTRVRIAIWKKVSCFLSLLNSLHAHAFTNTGQNHQNRLGHIEQTRTKRAIRFSQKRNRSQGNLGNIRSTGQVWTKSEQSHQNRDFGVGEHLEGQVKI